MCGRPVNFIKAHDNKISFISLCDEDHDHNVTYFHSHSGSTSLLPPTLIKLPSPFQWLCLGNLGNPGGKKEMQPQHGTDYTTGSSM